MLDVVKSDIIKGILVTLGCGVGEHFNINNLRYDKIIILTDADADGKHIELLLVTLFLKHLPELVKQGKIYAATPPLYRTINNSSRGKDKEVKYWYEDNTEYRKYIRTHKNIEITRFKGLGEMNSKELYETTMNPEKRHLVQLTTEDLEKTISLYDNLMGKRPELRRDFIIKNKLSNYDGDYEFNYMDDDIDDF